MSGGKKKRRDIQKGLDQANAATQQGVQALNPYAQGGLPAFNQANAFLGLGTPEQNSAALGQFNASPFKTIGETNFGLEKDAIDAGLSSNGLIFSSARQNAVEDARQRNAQNAFLQFLGLNQAQSGAGLQAAGGQANLYGQQGINAFNAGQAKAGTRQGFLGALGQISQIGKNFGDANTGFSDRRLKSNIAKIDDFGPLSVYIWRWNEDAEELGLHGEDVGFIADEVEKLIPEAVGMDRGYQTVDYAKVMERYSQ